MKLKLVDAALQPLPDMDNFAVVLCGGGGAGRWQAGVLAALAQHGILERTKVMSGTSIGGLNTGVFTLFGKSEAPPVADGESPLAPLFHTAVEMWESIQKNSDVYNGSLDSTWDKIVAGLGFITGKEAILDISPAHKMLERTVGNVTLEDAAEMGGREIIISSADLNSQFEEFYTSFGEAKGMTLLDAMKRTSAIPGVFKSISGKEKGGYTHWHIDGGVGANNPFIALNMYNEAFPGAQVKKVIVIYCYPDMYTDIGVGIVGAEDKKEYKCFRDVLLRMVSVMMKSQEQVAELIIQDKVKTEGWDVLALYPNTAPCDALDFTKTQILEDGYKYAVAGKGWSYKENCEVNILDFIKKK